MARKPKDKLSTHITFSLTNQTKDAIKADCRRFSCGTSELMRVIISDYYAKRDEEQRRIVENFKPFKVRHLGQVREVIATETFMGIIYYFFEGEGVGVPAGGCTFLQKGD